MCSAVAITSALVSRSWALVSEKLFFKTFSRELKAISLRDPSALGPQCVVMLITSGF